MNSDEETTPLEPEIIEWADRIVGEGEEDPLSLLASPLNWRLHKQDQQRVLTGVLDEIGWVQRIIINEDSQHVVDGHLRVMLAMAKNEQTGRDDPVPVLYVSLSEAEERVVLASLDPIAGLAERNPEVFVRLVALIRTQNDHVLDFLAKQVQVSLAGKLAGAPSLSDLMTKYGDGYEEENFWPITRLVLPASLAEAFVQRAVDEACSEADLLARLLGLPSVDAERRARAAAQATPQLTTHG